MIAGPGSETSDSIDAKLSKNEYVFKAKSAKKLGTRVMNYMNETGEIPQLAGHDVPAFKSGGQVKKTKQIKKGKQARKQSWPFGFNLANAKTDFAVPMLGGTASGDAKVAEIAESVARSMGATSKQLLADIEAGLVESGLHNLKYGDRDSVGYLQQRPSQGWGSVKQLPDPAFATRKFINAAKHVKGQDKMSAGELAQAVQRSAFPDRYNKREADAIAVLNRNAPYYSGPEGRGTTSPGGGGQGGGIGWRAMVNLIDNAGFNFHPSVGQTTGGGHAKNSWHYKGRAVDLSPPTNKAYDWILKNYGRASKELIYAPRADSNIKNGQTHRYGAGILNNHYSHIHWAMKKGGLVSGRGGGQSDQVLRALSNGEYVLNAATTKAIGVSSLNRTNKLGNIGASPTQIRGSMATAHTDLGSNTAQPAVNAQRFFDVNVQVTEDHQADLIVNRLNSLL